MAVCLTITAILLLVWNIPTGAKFFAFYLSGAGYSGQASNFAVRVKRSDLLFLSPLLLHSQVYSKGADINLMGLIFCAPFSGPTWSVEPTSRNAHWYSFR